MRAALSVVIPTHDTRELTLRCLETLGQVDERVNEIVLVDDGSRDGTTVAVRARFPSVRVVRHERALGFTASANDGLAETRGDVLLLLNSDTEVERASLPPLLDAFATDPRLGVASPRLVDPDGSPQWSGGTTPTLPWLFLLACGIPRALAAVPGYRRLRPVRSDAGGRIDWVTGAAMAIRRRTWEDVGPLDTRFRFYGQDLDFCLRAGDAGWRVALVRDSRVVHVGGATIGRRSGAARRSSHPGLLWTDLLLWGEKRHGRRWALRAASVLGLGGRLRLVARGMARPLVTGAERADWTRDTEAFRGALAELRRWRSEAGSSGAPE
jgi:N-acetylglucosaminyl-diphospho-decaprenol L-rhamnosyltransferase